MSTNRIDVVLDTDTYNEIDDQYAIAYLCRSKDKLNPVAFYAAPYTHPDIGEADPAEGMKRSYDEIFHILDLCGEEELKSCVYRGSETFMKNETEPVVSEAALDLVQRAKNYSPENPLYVVGIGAITNVASAFLMDPSIEENIVMVFLGGHAHHWPHTKEYNTMQDIAASRVIMSGKARFVQLPCFGVVSEFRVSGAELDAWLVGKNPLADYLATHTKEAAEAYAKGKPWTRVIWDVTSIGWLLNENNRFMNCDTRPVRLIGYDMKYEAEPIDKEMTYVYEIRRDALLDDLFKKILQ